MPTPLLLIGDSPALPTGLGRILNDLALQLANELELDVAVYGWDPTAVRHAWSGGENDGEGIIPPLTTFSDAETWGADTVADVYLRRFGERPGILWTVWDPGRCLPYLSVDLPVARWGYCAIDAHNAKGTIGGPAGEVLARYDRVLAYTRWGAAIIKGARSGSVAYLPHGIGSAFTAGVTKAEQQQAYARLGAWFRGDEWLIGCVATNQPRKDLGLYFGTLAELRRRGHKVYGWLHTDRTIGAAWSVPQLVADFDLGRRVYVTMELSDAELRVLYNLCHATIAPGLGEGFGYPIIESLACGTPVVHGTYGGGAELVPHPAWKVPVRESRLEGTYALVRPVYRADDLANAVESAVRWKEAEPAVAAAYCAGAVDHLRWTHIWPRWQAWVRQGLESLQWA